MKIYLVVIYTLLVAMFSAMLHSHVPFYMASGLFLIGAALALIPVVMFGKVDE